MYCEYGNVCGKGHLMAKVCARYMLGKRCGRNWLCGEVRTKSDSVLIVAEYAGGCCLLVLVFPFLDTDPLLLLARCHKICFWDTGYWKASELVCLGVYFRAAWLNCLIVYVLLTSRYFPASLEISRSEICTMYRWKYLIMERNWLFYAI